MLENLVITSVLGILAFSLFELMNIRIVIEQLRDFLLSIESNSNRNRETVREIEHKIKKIERILAVKEMVEKTGCTPDQAVKIFEDIEEKLREYEMQTEMEYHKKEVEKSLEKLEQEQEKIKKFKRYFRL